MLNDQVDVLQRVYIGACITKGNTFKSDVARVRREWLLAAFAGIFTGNLQDFLKTLGRR